MTTTKQKAVLALVRSTLAATAVIATAAWAQMTPVGTWRSIDDSTGEAKAEIRISETGQGLSGKIEKTLRPGARTVCDECTDDRKGQPIVGLEIIRGGAREEGQDVWSGGKILDPENGKEYRASLTPTDGGKKLQVRGFFGPFWRTQTWQRVQ